MYMGIFFPFDVLFRKNFSEDYVERKKNDHIHICSIPFTATFVFLLSIAKEAKIKGECLMTEKG